MKLKVCYFILSLLIFAGHALFAQPPVRLKPTTGRYRVTEVRDTLFHLFKTNDVLEVSIRNGLRHYRAGKLKGTYKIIPDTITVKRVAPCLVPPCPEFLDVIPVFYTEPINRFISFDDLEHKSYLEAYDPAIYRSRSNKPADRHKWDLIYILKKIKSN